MNPFNIKQNSDTFYSISTSVCSKIKMKSNKIHQKKNSWLPKHQRYLCFKTKQMAGARGRKIFNRQWQVTEIYTHTSLNESTRGRKRLNSWDIFTVGCMWKTTTSPPPFSFSFCSYGQPGLAVMNNSCIYRYTCLNSWPHKKLVATAYKPFAWWKIMVTVRCHAHLFIVITFTYIHVVLFGFCRTFMDFFFLFKKNV